MMTPIPEADVDSAGLTFGDPGRGIPILVDFCDDCSRPLLLLKLIAVLLSMRSNIRLVSR